VLEAAKSNFGSAFTLIKGTARDCVRGGPSYFLWLDLFLRRVARVKKLTNARGAAPQAHLGRFSSF
jgi:hypothetical protein